MKGPPLSVLHVFILLNKVKSNQINIKLAEDRVHLPAGLGDTTMVLSAARCDNNSMLYQTVIWVIIL